VWIGRIIEVKSVVDEIDDRMNMLHYVLYHTFNKRHYLTEFKDELPKRVLDIGCGTGIWIHDVAKQWTAMGHTDVEFVGVDLVPIQTPMVLLSWS
jgi:ubiquinone/menaquinone biosynthesis C-methylase UbiE